MNYDIVHCHTPLADMATRFGCKCLRKEQGQNYLYVARFSFLQGRFGDELADSFLNN